MQRTKQASKKKRMTEARMVKAAVPALGFAGLTFSLAGSAMASALPAAEPQQRPSFTPGHFTALSEEELADVNLATFHLAGDEKTLSGVLLARGCGGCGCRGCGGCRGCRGCGGCRACRCGVGCGGCGGCGIGWIGVPVACTGCCASWGRCRWC
ncbi:hypothetical protein [Bradyrhizobium commune]|uniref:Heterocycloanthracin/sonorensin family bacteriocin n=1 Tax=Bradyrhizobium commune TaxID=83627 RepID=A0A7S9D7E0_9BRAD|nr:hypothetical protein [Bradyrhizobium commune]QPF92587.1 hypothetical protein IC761_04680 [Bradyrhizobium commune]